MKEPPMPSVPEPRFLSSEKRLLVVSLLLAFAVSLAFCQVARNGFITYDDPLYLTGNPQVKNGLTTEGIRWAFTTGIASNWHPLTWISHMADVQLFGMRPGWHHLTSLFLHILNTVFLFLVLHRMTKALWQAAFVAALFALHPLHVESVAWAAERKDVLSTFFWMLSMWLYVSYTARRTAARYVALLACFAMGLMAKPMLVTLPFVLLLLDYWPLGRLELIKQPRETSNPRLQGAHKRKGKDSGRPAAAPTRPNVSRWALIRPLLAEKVPFFVLAGLSSIVTFIVQQRGGAVVPIEAIPAYARLENVFVSYVAYIVKMFWPANLAVLYPFQKGLPLWEAAGALAILVACTALAIKAARKRPYVPVGWLWYAGTLVPVIGIVQVGTQAMADRYTYIPLIGLFVIIAWGVPDMLKRWPHRKATLVPLSGLCFLSLFAVTLRQVGFWRTSLTLYSHTLEVADRNPVIYNNRGSAYNDLGDYAWAMPDFSKAIEMSPRYAHAYSNRGTAYAGLGNYRLAIADFDKAVELDPRYAHAYYNRGMIYNALGDHARAIADLDKAIELDPRYADAYSNRGAVHIGFGDSAKALADFNKAIEINPNLAKAYSGRGAAYGSLRNYPRAIADFSRAIEIDPRDVGAYVDRAAAYGMLGKREEAIADMRVAARLGNEGARSFLKSRRIDW